MTRESLHRSWVRGELAPRNSPWVIEPRRAIKRLQQMALRPFACAQDRRAQGERAAVQKSSRFICVPLLLLLAGCAPAQDVDQFAEALTRDQPKWLYDSAENTCPADVMAQRPVPVRYLGEVCIENPNRCVEGCKAGVGNDCFAMALAVEPIRGHTKLSDRLFLRACSLGVISACSSRASSMNSSEAVCQARTYEKACDRNDRWACLTLGMYLARGMGVERDVPRARKLITESCEFLGDEGRCDYGIDMLMEIDRIEKKQRDRMTAPPAGGEPPVRR